MGKKPLPEDFKDFIKYLNSNNVEYLLVGGWAVSLYGNPRLTKDIDFLISSSNENIDKLNKALLDFGANFVNIEEFKKNKEAFIRMGISPIQIDIIKQATGIIMEECYKRKNILNIEDIDINIISIKDLITNKRATGRGQDSIDAKKLEELINIKDTEYISISKDKRIDDIKAQIIKDKVKLYGDTVKYIKNDMKKKKETGDIQYNIDKEIIINIDNIYKKAVKSNNAKDWIKLHDSFNINPETKQPYHANLYNQFTYLEMFTNTWQNIETNINQEIKKYITKTC